MEFLFTTSTAKGKTVRSPNSGLNGVGKWDSPSRGNPVSRTLSSRERVPRSGPRAVTPPGGQRAPSSAHVEEELLSQAGSAGVSHSTYGPERTAQAVEVSSAARREHSPGTGRCVGRTHVAAHGRAEERALLPRSSNGTPRLHLSRVPSAQSHLR